MTRPQPSRGGAPVGFLTELTQTEAASICFLRQWCESPQTQKQAIKDLTDLLGSIHGPAAINSLGQICNLFTQFSRRPVMWRHPKCPCLGADESCFANLVAEAVWGDREDAMLIVRADCAPGLVALAEQFGLALSVLNRGVASHLSEGMPMNTTLH